MKTISKIPRTTICDRNTLLDTCKFVGENGGYYSIAYEGDTIVFTIEFPESKDMISESDSKLAFNQFTIDELEFLCLLVDRYIERFSETTETTETNEKVFYLKNKIRYYINQKKEN
jgi:hypothetical protein